MTISFGWSVRTDGSSCCGFLFGHGFHHFTIQKFRDWQPRILLSIGIARLEPGGEWATGVLDIACIVMGALIAFVWLVVMIAAA